MTRKKTTDDYYELAISRGFKWLGPEVPNANSNTMWSCGNGHQWLARYGAIYSGSGCPYCSGNVAKKPDDYHRLALSLDLVWLGPAAKNSKSLTKWQCDKGHTWTSTYSNIQSGRSCPYCSNRAQKTPEDFRNIAKKRGFEWLGPLTSLTKDKTEWMCSSGHRWMARYNNIQQGSGCPFCAGTASKTESDYYALAVLRDFQWLGPYVSTVIEKTSWQCQDGHQWMSTFSSIQQGSGCPICSGKAPKTPYDYHLLATKRGFQWLGPEVQSIRMKTGWKCAEGHQWTTRYNSIQQGYSCPFCAGTAKKIPDDYHALASFRGFMWLGPVVENTSIRTRWSCGNCHTWEVPYHDIQSGNGCPHCYGNFPKDDSDYADLALKRGIRWLGPSVRNVGEKTWWRCEDGHDWETAYDSIRIGHGCPYCAKVVPKTPQDYHDLATIRGYSWLGPEVPNTSTKTQWVCKEGHIWEARFSDINLKESSCPNCSLVLQAERMRIKPHQYHQLANYRGFRWIGPEVLTTSDKTQWECSRGHRWEARYNDVKHSNSGCPHCIEMVHGALVSKVQRELCELVGGSLNLPFDNYNIDVAVTRHNTRIAIEYDSWYWHAGKEQNDLKRDNYMIDKGWKVLRVRSNCLLPSKSQIELALSTLFSGRDRTEIMLDDWGKGPTKFGN